MRSKRFYKKESLLVELFLTCGRFCNKMDKILARTERLTGTDALQRLAQVKVLLIGVGGVGSWCAESLVRTGVTNLTIADCDHVCASNVNRQLMATTLSIGQPKVLAMRDRLLAINPGANIGVRQERFCQETAQSFNLHGYDYIIDAIDSIPDKALLILRALETDAVLYSSMGAALKMDPERIQVAEFWKAYGCPLAKALRNHFKKSGQFPQRKFQCVFSDERLENRDVQGQDDADRGNGTVAYITAMFGLRLSALLIRDVVGQFVKI